MKTFFSMTFKSVFLALISLFTAVPALAQYPAKPIRLIIPFSAGGASDTAARALGQVLSKSMGQSVLIENRPGASGSIAAQAVLSAPADGYTLLWASASMVAIPFLQRSAPYQSLAEFTPVTMVGRLTYCLFVPMSVPAKSVGEFISYARANSGKLSFATGSLGELMVTAQFLKSAGITMVQVPYKGGAQAMPDLIAGRVQMNFGPFAGGFPHVKDGKLQMLATLTSQRSPAAPDVPTLTEAGVANVSSPTWQAIFAPPKTPKGIVERISREVALALRDAGLKEHFGRQAVQIEPSTAEGLSATIREDVEMWQRFIRENNIPQE